MSKSPPVALSDEIKQLVNGALAAGHPILLACVSAEGKPVLSFRGSIQAYSDDQLGFWVRGLDGGTLRAIGANPAVAFMYRANDTRAMFQFHGRARVAVDEAERARVFENCPELERNADPDRKGAAIIVDLDRVEGFFGFGADGPIGFTRQVRG
jgi:hypothetical protein